MKPLRRVAVLGAGTMGSRIAAHFANAGVPALLLDLPSPGPNRNAIATAALDAAAKQKPVAYFTPDTRSRITVGNFEDDLPALAACDWILEAVVENLEIKRSLFARVLEHRRPGTILSTNTSGIPLRLISENFDEETARYFLGTHFFNPPRYLHLVEVIPGPSTDPGVLRYVTDYCDLRLGKGVVLCKDTPNFIANRIGSYFGGTVQALTLELDLTIEEVDALTGPLIGLPKSASYRLMDIVGIDVWDYVNRNLYEAVPHDPGRDRFVTPDFVREMISRGWLGEKRGQGFYKRQGKGEILVIDRKTLEYRAQTKPRWASVDAARNIENLPERLRTLCAAQDKAGTFLSRLFHDHIAYATSMVPEISDRPIDIDRAMRWGYNHALGPFELADALGRSTPFGVSREAEPRPGILVLSGKPVVEKNAGASLRDLGDGVLCLEFHSKMNTIGEDFIQMINAGIEETERNYDALVVANQGENFSAGANLMMVLLAAQEGEWDELNRSVRRFQNANMAMKYAAKPVVAAPFGLTLGGGCEIALHASRMQASAELYMGLVEVGVGVIPAGGGCKELLARGIGAKAAFEMIGFAKVSGSAAEARQMGFLKATDSITMNAERLIADAKDAAILLSQTYTPPVPADVKVEGESAFALMKLAIFTAKEGGFLSVFDAQIGEKLAFVLSGGRVLGPQTVSEQHLLDLEREAFLSLCGTRETQERMQHMLKTGKPLRN